MRLAFTETLFLPVAGGKGDRVPRTLTITGYRDLQKEPDSSYVATLT